MRARLAIGALIIASAAHAEDEPERPPLPESLLTESATDVDAESGGEVEYEANFVTLGARRGGARATMTSLELEWRVFRDLGLRVEPTFTHVTEDRFGLEGALAYGLFHDFAHDFHLQAELLGRIPESETERVFEPGESELPASANLLAAYRVGRFTWRATVGGEAGGSFAHAPLHTDFAMLTPILSEERFGFFAIEARADWARAAPFVIAPEIVADTTPLGLPFRLGIALPVNLGADETRPSYGMFVRLIMLTSREVEYGRTGKSARED